LGTLGDAVMPLPAWLPDTIELNPWNEQTFENLYVTFCAEFRESQLSLSGSRVWYFPEKEDGRERIFWHLTHRDDERGERLPDPRRCERLKWVRAMLENCHDPEVLFWDFKESDGTVHTYLWLHEHKFAVILKKYPDGSRRLVTSYFVDKEGKERTFRSKYKRRM
jgi:hypothetical protein